MKEKEKKESEKANAPFVDVGERFKIEKQKRKKCEGEVCVAVLFVCGLQCNWFQFSSVLVVVSGSLARHCSTNMHLYTHIYRLSEHNGSTAAALAGTSSSV